MTATRGTDLSPPGTTETHAGRAASIADYQSSAALSHDNFVNGEEIAGKNNRQGDNNTAGRMLDSDGFELARMDADDFENLTLEEKILCGYYTAKPSLREAYPIAQLNIPKNYWLQKYRNDLQTKLILI